MAFRFPASCPLSLSSCLSSSAASSSTSTEEEIRADSRNVSRWDLRQTTKGLEAQTMTPLSWSTPKKTNRTTTTITTTTLPTTSVEDPSRLLSESDPRTYVALKAWLILLTLILTIEIVSDSKRFGIGLLTHHTSVPNRDPYCQIQSIPPDFLTNFYASKKSLFMFNFYAYFWRDPPN